MDERSDGGWAAAERCSDVGFGEVDVEAKHQRRLLSPRQPCERVEHLVVIGHHWFGRRRRISGDHGLMAVNIATSVHDYRTQVRRRVEHRRSSHLQANERVLHDLLGGRPRAGQQIRDSNERRPLPFVQVSEPCPVDGTPWLSVGSHHILVDGSGTLSVARRSQFMSHCCFPRDDLRSATGTTDLGMLPTGRRLIFPLLTASAVGIGPVDLHSVMLQVSSHLDLCGRTSSEKLRREQRVTSA